MNLRELGSLLTTVLILFSQGVSAVTISLNLDDNTVNPGEEITLWGQASDEGPLENFVSVWIDNQLVSYQFTSDWSQGILENLTVSEGRLTLSFGYDFDIIFVDNSGELRMTDGTEIKSLGVLADAVGGCYDVDGDGDIDVVYRRGENLYYKDFWGSEHQVPYSGADGPVTDVGGVGNFDGGTDVEVVIVLNGNHPGYMKLNGTYSWFGTLSGTRAGWMADLDGDGDNDALYATYPNLYAWDSASNTVLSYTDYPTDAGGMADWDGDGDIDAFYVKSGALKYIDKNKNVVTLLSSGVSKVGDVRDWEGDGQPDVAFIGIDNYLKVLKHSGQTVNLGILAQDVGGIADLDADTGYRLSGQYTSPWKDWKTPHVLCQYP
jgi:hypothetical protein